MLWQILTWFVLITYRKSYVVFHFIQAACPGICDLRTSALTCTHGHRFQCLRKPWERDASKTLGLGNRTHATCKICFRCNCMDQVLAWMDVVAVMPFIGLNCLKVFLRYSYRGFVYFVVVFKLTAFSNFKIFGLWRRQCLNC